MSVTLAAAGTIQGVSTSAATVTYTLAGLELAGATDATAGTIKALAQGQLPSSAGALYTVPASQSAVVQTIHLSNTGGTAQTVVVYANGTGAANELASVVIPANGSAVYNGTWSVYDSFGNLQAGVVTGYALDSAVVHLAGSETITGSKQFNSDVLIRGRRPWVDVVAYGADPTGATDTTTAIQSAITAAGANGTVYFPPGTYIIGSALSVANNFVSLIGAGDWVTVLMRKYPTGDTINCSTVGFTIIRDMQINAASASSTAGGTLSGTPQTIATGGITAIQWPASGTVSIGLTNGTWTTMAYTSISGNSFVGCTGSGAFSASAPILVCTAGYAIDSANNLDRIEDISIFNHFNGILIPNAVQVTIRDIFLYNSINDGIVVNGGSAEASMVNVRCVTNYSSNRPATGFHIQQCGNIYMTGCQVIRAMIGMHIDPAGSGVFSVWCVNTELDNCTTAGLRVIGTIAVQRCKWLECWFSGAETTNGVHLNNANASALDFDDCDFYLTSGRGLYSQACAEWSASRCRVAGNTTAGIEMVASSPAPDITVENNLIGAETGGIGGNGTGIIVGAGAYANLAIVNNKLAGNTTAAFTDSGATFANPAQKSLYGNTGLSIAPRPNVSATTISGTTETVMTAWGGQIYLPANSLLVGTTFRLDAYGILTGTTPSILPRIRLGTAGTTADTQVCATAATTEVSGNPWRVVAYVTIRSIGSGGTAIGNVELDATTAARTTQTATVAVNTTVANFLSFTLTGGGTSPVITPPNVMWTVIQQ